MGCSQKSSDYLFGSTLPIKGITKELPVIAPPHSFASKALTVEYQKHLDTLMENEIVKVDSLLLFQNGESYLPLMKMIDHSKKYFYMNLLSFTCDEATEEMVLKLMRRAGHGLDVRLIINTGFSYLSRGCLKRLESSGVKILKGKTHSSYFLNDQKELMIGSQSVARMFFLSDGFNSLDRDMMIYSQGPLATDAFHDFISLWADKKNSQSYSADVYQYQELVKEDYLKNKRGKALYENKTIEPDKACRFISERPQTKIKDIQDLWGELININEKELFFSGVKVDIGEGHLGNQLQKKSLEKMEIHYLGNGYLSGNGELTMVLNEWILSLKKNSWTTLASLLEKINDWDKRRLALKNQKLYDALKGNSPMNIWAYFNFIHYKVWLFDHPGFFIGSANLDEDKWNVLNEAGIYCLDSVVHNQLKAQLLRDRSNSVLYKETK